MKYIDKILFGSVLGFLFGIVFFLFGSLFLNDAMIFQILQLTIPPFSYIPFGFVIECAVIGALIGFIVARKKTNI